MRGRKVVLVVSGPGERIRDEEGRWTSLGQDRSVHGTISSSGSRDRFVGRRTTGEPGGLRGDVGGEAETEQAVAHVPLGAAVAKGYTVTVDGVDPVLDGEWRVEGVVVTRRYYRTFLERDREV